MLYRKGRKIALIGLLLFLIPFQQTAGAPDGKPNQRKIERERARNEKKARKEYEKALKQHQKNQSPETRSMMKKAKKDKKRQTPLKKSSGRKCK